MNPQHCFSPLFSINLNMASLSIHGILQGKRINDRVQFPNVFFHRRDFLKDWWILSARQLVASLNFHQWDSLLDSTRFLYLRNTLGLALWHSELNHCLQQHHLTWVPVWVLPTPLLIQLPASLPGKVVFGSLPPSWGRSGRNSRFLASA